MGQTNTYFSNINTIHTANPNEQIIQKGKLLHISSQSGYQYLKPQNFNERIRRNSIPKKAQTKTTILLFILFFFIVLFLLVHCFLLFFYFAKLGKIAI